MTELHALERDAMSETNAEALETAHADRLICEAIQRLEVDAHVGEGYNWRHVYRVDAPHDRDRAINVLGKRDDSVIAVGIYFRYHLHKFVASPEYARLFWESYDRHEQRLRERVLNAYSESLKPKPRKPIRIWPFGKALIAKASSHGGEG